MEMEDESLTHLRNLMQSFCNQIQLKVISPAAAGDDFYYNSEEFVGNEDASSSDLAVLLKSTQHELKLARLREKQLETRLNQLQSEFEREVQSRKAIHDELMEIRGNIRVFLRPRPPTVVGLGEEEETIKLLPETGSVIHIPTERRFEFDACIDSQFTQADLFESQVAPFVVSAMDGKNVTLVAYGQTGSGKTYTMEGSKNDPGVYTRSLQRAFQLSNARKEKHTFHVSILEVYNDTLRDLLMQEASSSADKLELHTDERKRVFVKNLSKHAVSTAQSVEILLQLASQRRIVGSHAMNEHSSRSHLVLMLDINAKSKMTFIDLAGSERAKDTGATGERFRESQHINRSLSCLGDVLQSMSDKTKTHHPFRNSKLTFLLQDSLTKHAKVAFFACVSPEQKFAGETFSTLAFAERIRKVELGGGSAVLSPRKQ